MTSHAPNTISSPKMRSALLSSLHVLATLLAASAQEMNAQQANMIFKQLDTDGDGTLAMYEVQNFYNMHGTTVSNEEVGIRIADRHSLSWCIADPTSAAAHRSKFCLRALT